MCFNAINGSGPAYLSELLHVYTPSRTIRSSSDSRMLKIQQHKHETRGIRTLSCFRPHIWNSLSQDHFAQPRHLSKPNWKPSSSHSIFAPTNISTVSAIISVCVCLLLHVIPSTLKIIFGQKGLMLCNNESMPLLIEVCACVSVCARARTYAMCMRFFFFLVCFLSRPKNDCA